MHKPEILERDLDLKDIAQNMLTPSGGQAVIACGIGEALLLAVETLRNIAESLEQLIDLLDAINHSGDDEGSSPLADIAHSLAVLASLYGNRQAQP